MLNDIRLPFHPTTTDCLAWSEDGELAVAANEFVHVLVLIKQTSKSIDPYSQAIDSEARCYQKRTECVQVRSLGACELPDQLLYC